MKVFEHIDGLQGHLQRLYESQTVGFVPTMGALHSGHLSIVEKALRENDVVVVSIYVNPTQFDNKTDLKKYPRNIKKDLRQLEYIGCQVVYTPITEEIYNDEITVSNFNFNTLETVMEGKYRPGHFDGVATVVKKLLEIVKPTNAYFGEKDFQQLRIVQKLVEQEKIPVDIIPCPIFREPSGLAMSSRNERLTPAQRENAANIFQTLLAVRMGFGHTPVPAAKKAVTQYFSEHSSLALEYFEIAEADTLQPVQKVEKGKKYRAFIAVYADEIRLIDNIALN